MRAFSRQRYQIVRGTASLDLVVSYPRTQYLLQAETEDGTCADNFEIDINGQGPVYSYEASGSIDGPVAHATGVDPSLITSPSVTVTFRNTATDDCGKAAVYNVSVTGAGAVGGFAELPAVAGSSGTSGMGGPTYAVLAGAAAGVLAFAVLATLSVRRWRP